MMTLSPPGSSQDQGRPRATTTMSHASTHSHRSSHSTEEKKLELVESKREQRMLDGKANPLKALAEAQPAAVAHEDSTIQNVRTMQYRDREGNVINDPDRSNPTRARMERPLDTIRAFNDAAEGTTSRRSSYQRPASTFNSWEAPSRRSSYYGGSNTPYSQHGARSAVGRGPGGYYNNNYNSNPNTHANSNNVNNNRNPFHGGYRPDQGDADYNQPQGQGRYQRFQSAPMSMATQMNQLHPQPSHVSQHGHQQSYETMHTAISASGSDEMSKSTNPSSQNSSFDQLHQIGRKPEDSYNSHRQNGNQMRRQNGPQVVANHNNYGQQQQYQQPPPPPPHQQQQQQQPQQQQQWNGRRVDEYGMEISDRPPPPPKQNFMNNVREMAPGNGGRGEKRQSWLKRTFSKKGI